MTPLHFNKAVLDSTWLYSTLAWLYLALRSSTILYHGSTTFYHGYNSVYMNGVSMYMNIPTSYPPSGLMMNAIILAYFMYSVHMQRSLATCSQSIGSSAPLCSIRNIILTESQLYILCANINNAQLRVH